MSELLERYEKEKYEKSLPKEKTTVKQIITFGISFLFFSSILFIIYIMNHDIEVSFFGKGLELLILNPPLFIGIGMFILIFLFGILVVAENTNKNDMVDILISFFSVTTVSFICSAFSYLIVYIITFRWVN